VQLFGYIEKDGRMLERPVLTGGWKDRIVAHMPDGSQWTVFEVNPLLGGPNRCADCNMGEEPVIIKSGTAMLAQ